MPFSPTVFTLGVPISLCSGSVDCGHHIPPAIFTRIGLGHARCAGRARRHGQIPIRWHVFPQSPASIPQAKFPYRMYMWNFHTQFPYPISIPNVHTQFLIPNFHTQISMPNFLSLIAIPDLHTRFLDPILSKIEKFYACYDHVQGIYACYDHVQGIWKVRPALFFTPIKKS